MIRYFTLSVTSRTVVKYKPTTMKLIYVSLVVLVCIVIQIQSERTRSGMCKGCQHNDYIRIKRAKYYSSPPLRFYNRPPMTFPVKGVFSYTPPPGYQIDDGRQPQNSKPKVSGSRPTSEELGDEDINNIMRFLTKQDLDKIVDNDNTFGLDNDNRIPQREHSINTYHSFRPYSIEYKNPNINEIKETIPFRFSEIRPSAFIYNNHMKLNTKLVSEEIKQNQQGSNLKNTYTYPDINENRNSPTIFTDSSIMQEEQLPRPSNLREDDFEVSYTNNVPTVVEANSNSYKIENFGSLPLMNYHSKLESVDSYKVPHYTVTSPEKYRAASNAKIPVEPAPPVSTAQEQSDAHLKAIKIWTHKSKGTAYTLHDDGTLSLEKPSRPNINFSHP